MRLNLRIANRVQQRLVIFIHQNYRPQPCPLLRANKQIPKTPRQPLDRVLNPILRFPAFKHLRQNILQSCPVFIILTVEVKIKNRIAPPRFRIITLKLFNLEPREKLPAALPISLHRRQQKTLAETTRPAEKVLTILPCQLPDKLRLISVYIILRSQFLKILNTDRQLTFHGGVPSIPFIRILSSAWVGTFTKRYTKRYMMTANDSYSAENTLTIKVCLMHHSRKKHLPAAILSVEIIVSDIIQYSICHYH